MSQDFFEVLENLKGQERRGEITLEQYQEALDALELGLAGGSLEGNSALESLGVSFPAQKEVVKELETPYTPPEVLPYRPQSNIEASRQRFLRFDIARHQQMGMDYETAKEKAMETANRLLTKPTVDERFNPQSRFFVSDVVDVEEGLILDEKEGVREGGQLELGLESLKRQRIAQAPSAERFWKETKLQSQQQKDTAQRLLRLEQRLNDGELDQSEYDERVKMVLQYNRVSEMTPAGQALDWFMATPIAETGEVIESYTSVALRYLNIIPAVVATAQEQVSPNTSETDYYRKAASGMAVDQMFLNIAKGQGVASFVASNDHWANVMGGRENAFWLGMGMELPLPALPSTQAVTPFQKALRTTSKKLADAGKSDAAMRVLTVSHPIETMKTRAYLAKVDDIYKQLGMDDVSNLQTRRVLDDAFGDLDDPLPQAMRENVRTSVSETVSARMVETEMLQYIEDSSDLAHFWDSDTLVHLGRKDPELKRLLDLEEIEPSLPMRNDIAKRVRAAAKKESDILKQQVANLAEAGDTSLARVFNEAQAIGYVTKEMFRVGDDVENVKQLRSSPLTVEFFNELGKTTLAKKLGASVADDMDVALSVQDLVTDALLKGDLGAVKMAGTRVVGKTLGDQFLNFLPEDLIRVAGSVVVPSRSMRNTEKFDAFRNANKELMESFEYGDDLGEGIFFPAEMNDDLIRIFIDEVGAENIRRSDYYKKILADMKNGNFVHRDQFGVVKNAIFGFNAKKHLDGFDFRIGGEQWRRATIPEEFRGDVFAVTREKGIIEQVKKGVFGQVWRDFALSIRTVNKNLMDTGAFIPLAREGDMPSAMLDTVKRINSKRVQIPKQLQKEIQEMMKDMPKHLGKEGQFVKTMDMLMEETFISKVEPMIQKFDALIERGFHGDYVRYLAEWENGRWGKQMMVHLTGSVPDEWSTVSLREALLERLGSEEVVQSELRRIIHEYKKFEKVVEEWESMMKNYYGASWIELSSLGSKLSKGNKSVSFKDYIVVGGVSIDDPTKFLSKESTYLKLNYSNTLDVMKRMEASLEHLQGKGLKSVGLASIKENYVYAPFLWIVGAREGRLTQREMKKFFDMNPRYAVNVLSDTKVLSGRQSSKVLLAQYEEKVEKIPDLFIERFDKEFKKILKESKDLDNFLSDKQLQQQYKTLLKETKEQVKDLLSAKAKEGEDPTLAFSLAEKMTNTHMDVLSKVTIDQAKTLVGRIFETFGDSSQTTLPQLKASKEAFEAGIETGEGLVPTGRATIKPDLMSMRASIEQEYLASPLEQMNFRASQIVGQDLMPGLRGRLNDMLDQLGFEKEIMKPSSIHKMLSEQLYDTAYNVMIGGSWDMRNGRYLSAPTYSVAEESLLGIRDFFRSQGVAVDNRILTIKGDAYPRMITDEMVRHNPNFQLMGTAWGQEALKMLELSADGRLAMTMDRLRKVDGGKAVIAWLENGLDTSRRVMSQGMLGGFPFPNVIYLAQNIITAPIIMTMTVGFEKTYRSLRQLGTSLKLNGMSRNATAFVSDSGQVYKAGHLQDLMSKYNIGMTRADIELYEGVVDEIVRGAGVDVSGKKLNRIPFLSAVDLRYRTIYSQMADNTDMTFRQAVFMQALKEDMPLEEAVALAQRSLLDYGAMGRDEKAFFNRYTLFWSFTRQSMTEFVNASYKAITEGGTADYKILLNLARAQQKQHKAQGDWLYETDKQKARLWKIYQGTVDRQKVYGYGYSNPYVEGMESVIGAVDVLFLGLEGRFGDAASKVRLRPEQEYIVSLIRGKFPRTVPSDVVAFHKALGSWNHFADTFDVQIKPESQRRTGDAVWGEYEDQYEFSKDKAAVFHAFILAKTMMGLERTHREYTRIVMTGGDEQQLKRFALSDPLLYTLGIARPMKTTDIGSVISGHQAHVSRQFNNLAKEKQR